MDISKLLKIKDAWNIFKSNHPKFDPFLSAVKNRGISKDSVLNISINYPDGSTIKSNIRVTESDLNLLDILTEL